MSITQLKKAVFCLQKQIPLDIKCFFSFKQLKYAKQMFRQQNASFVA